MAVINDIVNKIVPAAQKHVEEEGMDVTEALRIEFNKNGYITDKYYWSKYNKDSNVKQKVNSIYEILFNKSGFQ